MSDPNPIEGAPAGPQDRTLADSDAPEATGSLGDSTREEARPAGLIGQTIGDYRILREIGRGGMGVVYEAEQVSLGRQVALKMLPQQASPAGITMQRFRREARAAARLHHTNIVPVFEIVEEGDLAYYTMQYIEGQSLDNVIQELRRLKDLSRHRPGPLSRTADVIQGPTPEIPVEAITQGLIDGRFLPTGPVDVSTQADPAESRIHSPDDRTQARPDSPGTEGAPFVPPEAIAKPPNPSAISSAILPGGASLSESQGSHRRFHRSIAQLGRQAASALAHAHARGIVHRDIKPSNLMLDTDGVAWITDFGLAKAEDDGLTQTGDLIGTLRYMAPERFRGEGDHRADTYALGLTLYELVTFRPAFDHQNRLHLIDQIKNADPPRPRTVDPRIPLDLETIILKAIEKDPGARYPTATALGEDLRRFLADEPVLARRITTLERYARWARRNPALAILGGCLTAVLILVSLGSLLAASYYQTLAVREKAALEQARVESGEAIKARQSAEVSRNLEMVARTNSDRQSAELALERGTAIARGGEPDKALHWFLQCLRISKDPSLNRAALGNLGGWLGSTHAPSRIFLSDSPVHDAGFSADQSRIVVARSRDPELPVQIWEVATGRLLDTIDGYMGPMVMDPREDVAYLHRRIDGRLVALDLTRKTERWVCESSRKTFVDLFLDPERDRIFLSSWDEVATKIIDRSSGRQIGPDLTGRFTSITADGAILGGSALLDGVHTILLYDLKHRRPNLWIPGERKYVSKVKISPDGRIVHVVVRDEDNVNYLVQVFDGRTGRKPVEDKVGSMDWYALPTHDRGLVLGQFAINLTDRSGRAGFGKVLRRREPEAFDSSGTRLVTTAADYSVSIWNLVEQALALSLSPDVDAVSRRSNLRMSMRYNQDSLSPDGRIAIRIQPKELGEQVFLRLHETTTQRPLTEPLFLPMPRVRSIVLSADGQRMAVGIHPKVFGEVRVYDLRSGALLFRPIWLPNYPACLKFTPDGSILAIGGFDHTVRFWDVATGKECLPMISEDDIISTLAFVPDQPGLLAVGCHPSAGKKEESTGFVRIWDYRLGRPRSAVLKHNTGPLAIHFVPGTNRIVVSDETGSRVHDTAAGLLIGKPLVEEISVALIPGREEFLTGGADGFVRLRTTTTAAALGTILEMGSRVNCLAIHPSGILVAAGCQDGTVQVADIEARQPLGPPLSMPAAIKELRFSPDGDRVIAQDFQGQTRVWPIPRPLPTTDLDDLTLLVEARTGYRVEADRSITPLPPSEWQAKLEESRRLDKLLPRSDDAAWIECRVREAEEARNAYSAAALLRRRIQAQPSDPWLKARLARARGWLGEWDAVAIAYRELEASLAKDGLERWFYHCAIEAMDAKAWDEACWYLDRLTTRRPGDPILRDRRALALDELGRKDEASADRDLAIRLGPPPHLALPRATELGMAGRWDQAATVLRDCVQSHCLSPYLLEAWAVASLRTGSPAKWREFRRDVLDQLSDRRVNRVDVLQLVDSLGLVEIDAESEAVLRPFLERLVPGRRSLSEYAIGMGIRLYVRLGRDRQALDLFESYRATPDTPVPPDQLAALAVAYHRLGQHGRALELLDRARNFKVPDDFDLWSRHVFQIWLKDAESRILHDPGFPADPFQFPADRK